jgi:hypothetical protein
MDDQQPPATIRDIGARLPKWNEIAPMLKSGFGRQFGPSDGRGSDDLNQPGKWLNLHFG